MPDLRSQFSNMLKRFQTPFRALFAKKHTSGSKHLAMAQVIQAKQSGRVPSTKQLRYFPSLLSHKEKIIASFALLAIILSGSYMILSIIGANQQTIPAVGGTYTEGVIGAPQLINPLYSTTSDVDSDLARIIYSGLMRFDPATGITEDLAESYNISEDNLQYTFVIRENAKWHDGDPVLADDVIFTINAIQNTQYRSPLSTSFTGVTVSQVDDRTVRFDLEKKSPDFLKLITVGILPSHLWQDITANNAVLTALNIKPIGSGPYMFEMLEKDNKTGEIHTYTVKRFNDYYQDGPYIESITFKFYPDINSAISALQNHNIEGISYLPVSEATRFENDDRISLMQAGLHEYVAAFFNPEHSDILADVAVRKALCFATYKEKIIDEVFGGYAKQMESFVLPGTTGFVEDAGDVIFDQKYATVMLDEAGWVVNQETGLRTKDETVLSLTITTIDSTELISVANLLKSQWEELGIQVEISTIDQATLQSTTLKNHDYDILLSGEIYDTNLDPYAFWHSSQTGASGLNLAQFENDDVDDLLETIQIATTTEEREQALEKAQEIILADYPAIFLYQPQYTYAVSSAIKNADVVRISMPSDRFSSIDTWYIKTRKSLITE